MSEARRLKTLEEENRRLKRLVADLSLDNAMLKDVWGESDDDASAAASRHLSGRRVPLRNQEISWNAEPIPQGGNLSERETAFAAEELGDATAAAKPFSKVGARQAMLLQGKVDDVLWRRFRASELRLGLGLIGLDEHGQELEDLVLTGSRSRIAIQQRLDNRRGNLELLLIPEYVWPIKAELLQLALWIQGRPGPGRSGSSRHG